MFHIVIFHIYILLVHEMNFLDNVNLYGSEKKVPLTICP